MEQKKLKAYLSYYPNINARAIIKKIDKVLSYNFPLNSTFMNFFFFLFPEVELASPELVSIVQKILNNHSIGIGGSYFWLVKMKHYWHLKGCDDTDLLNWTYKFSPDFTQTPKTLDFKSSEKTNF